MLVSQRPHRESISTRVRRATRKTSVMEMITEFKGKIKMKDRQQHTLRERHGDTREENEQIIMELRMDNLRLRKAYQDFLHADTLLLGIALEGRKRLALALRRRSVDFAITDIDNSICNLKRKYNALKYKRKTLLNKKYKLRDEESIAQNAKPVALPAEVKTTIANLRNSINNIDMKLISGAQMRILYNRIKQTVENQIIHYPKILNDVEKKIFIQRVEIENLIEMKKESYEERDLTLKMKLNLEVEVRESRHEREALMRNARRTVKRGRAALYHSHVGGKVVTYQVESVPPPVKPAISEERQRRCEEYKTHAAMLEVVTGVSFTNGEDLINCFKAQKKSSASLQRQVERRRRSQANSKILLRNYQKKYDKLKYTYKKKKKDKRVADLKEMIKEELSKKEEISMSHSKNLLVLAEVESWLRLFVLRLQSTSQRLDISSTVLVSPKDSSILNVSRFVENVENASISHLFTMCKDILYRLYARDLKWTSVVSSVDTMFARQKNEKILLNRNNNRILRKLLERKQSEEFEYNTPTNEEYKSREAIKLQSSLIQRRGHA